MGTALATALTCPGEQAFVLSTFLSPAAHAMMTAVHLCPMRNTMGKLVSMIRRREIVVGDVAL